jgi:hypothetical protein
MIRRDEPVSVLTAIIIALASVGCFVFVVVVQRLQSLQNEIAASNSTPVDVSGWQTYRSDQYGFEFEYPPGWDLSTDGLSAATPSIALGNPLSGIKTYAMQIFIENNPSSLSSGEYAHTVIDAAHAADTAAAAASADGQAPQTAPRFDKAYVLTVGGYSAYELYNVFEFDHNAERIYIADPNAGSNVTLHFDFPVAQENPNLSLPVANNAIAHEIINTLSFTN